MIKKTFKELGIPQSRVDAFLEKINRLEISVKPSANSWFVAGGLTYKLVNGDDFTDSDVDIWFADSSVFQNVVSVVEANEPLETEYISEDADNPFWLSELTVGDTSYDFIYAEEKSSVKGILASFDFEHCKVIWAGGDELILGEFTEEALKERKLITSLKLKDAKEKAGLLERTLKYSARGFEVTPSVICEITGYEAAVEDLKKKR